MDGASGLVRERGVRFGVRDESLAQVRGWFGWGVRLGRGDRAGLGYRGESVAATSGMGGRDRAREEGQDAAVARGPGQVALRGASGH